MEADFNQGGQVMPASRAILVTGSDSEVYDLLVEASSARDWLVKRSRDTAETLVQLQSRALRTIVKPQIKSEVWLRKSIVSSPLNKMAQKMF